MTDKNRIKATEMASKNSIKSAESCTFFHAQYQDMPTHTANSRTCGACNPTISRSVSAKTAKPVAPATEMPR